MKLIVPNKKWRFQRRQVYKFFLIMKLTCIIMVVGCLQVSAMGYGQMIHLSIKKKPLEKVLRLIEKQTDFHFYYKVEDISKASAVTANFNNVPLDEALNKLFSNQSLSYNILGNNIIICEKSPEKNSNLNKEKKVLTIRGTVLDAEKGIPLFGASIILKGTDRGIATNQNGEFVFEKVPENATLVFSYTGYKSQEVQVNSERYLTILLQRSIFQNKEVKIYTGYGTKSVNEVTGSIQQLSGKELRSSVSTPNILSMLKAKTTGMYIVENSSDAGAKGEALLRGQSSFASGASGYFGPLIVVDGIITDYTNLMDAVNPTDVESITILKDAASTAIYGSRAAQGVIVITTKRGDPGELSITFSSRYGVNEPRRDLRFMNSGELIDFMDTHMRRYWEQTPRLQDEFPNVENFINERRVYTEDQRNIDYNWEDKIYNNGNFSDINLGLTSGTSKTRIYTSLNWYREEGVRYGDGFSRKSLLINLDQIISPKLTVSLKASAILDRTETRNGVPSPANMQPFISPYKDDGSLADSLSQMQSYNFGPPTISWGNNFLAEAPYDNTAINNMQNYLGAITLKYDILPWLNIKSTNSLNYVNNYKNSYMDRRTFSGKYGGGGNSFWLDPPFWLSTLPPLPNGTLSITDDKFNSFLTSNTINFKHSFGPHNLSALLGQEWGKRSSENMNVDAFDILPGERNLGAANSFGNVISITNGFPYSPSGYFSERATFSIFGDANYNLDQRYFFSASLRTDATTNFGREKRYGTFYSLSGAWLISNESFLRNNKLINNLKLRFVHGTSGRDVGDGYLNVTTYSSYAYYGSYNSIGATISQLENPQISWETTINNTLGLDIGLWDRIDLTVDIYHKRSSDLLQLVKLSAAQGALSQYQNIGEIVNKGLELMLNADIIKSDNFTWHTDFNISFNKNLITKLYQDSLYGYFFSPYYKYIGDDINSIKAIKYVGVNPDNGAPLFENFNSEGKIENVEGIGNTNDLRNYQLIGSKTPKFFGGFSTAFTYKNLTLSTELWFQYGNYVTMPYLNPLTPRFGSNLLAPADNQHYWRSQGDTEANYPDIFSTELSLWRPFDLSSSLRYGDASHIRLRNIRLQYNLSQKLSSRLRLKGGYLFVSCDNVYVWKRKNFYASDPEGARISSVGGTGISYSNADAVATGSANPRRFVVGLNVTF